MTQEKPENFCIVPFVHLHMQTTNNLGLCCSWKPRQYPQVNSKEDTIETIWQSDYYKDVRRRVLNNEIIPGCESCFTMEKAGIISDRLFHNGRYKNVTLDIDNGNSYRLPLSYDLRYDNTCNLKCVMCSSASSSQIEKETIENIDLHHYSDWFVEELDAIEYYRKNRKNWFENYVEKLTTLDHLSFFLLGGEPSIIKEYHEVLDKLIDLGKTDAKLFITTNLTNIRFDFFEKLNHFDKVILNLSLDGIYSHAEYIRSPLNFQQWVTNFEKLVDFNKDRIAAGKFEMSMTIHCTVMSLNLYHLPDFIRYFAKKINEVHYLSVTFTKINEMMGRKNPLGPQQIPIADRYQIKTEIEKLLEDQFINSKFRQSKILPILEELIEVPYDPDYEGMSVYLLERDIPRNRNIKDSIPEIYKLIKNEYDINREKMLAHRNRLASIPVTEYKGKRFPTNLQDKLI